MNRFATALLCLAAAAPAAAQVPIHRPGFDEAAVQYRSYALSKFDAVVQEWTHAVNTGNFRDASGLYTEDAYAEMGEPARGREAVLAFLRGWVGRIDHVQVGLSDFDASGSMAYGTLQVRIVTAGEGARTGTMLLVLRKHDGDWLIRAQTLTLH